MNMGAAYIAITIFILALIGTSVRVLWEYERAVVFRLGRMAGIRGPGLIFLIPFWIERMQKVSLRTMVQEVETQDVITLDNVSVKVDAVLAFRVENADKAVLEVEEYKSAIVWIAQTTLRSVLGRAELDELLAEREKLNHDLQKIVAEHCEPWGIKVMAMEVRAVDLPDEMRRAMAKQAEAERERRAKVIHAKGEEEAAEILTEAASILSKNPSSIQLRYLQSLVEISSEQSSTVIFPIPIDIITHFFKSNASKKD
jgi:regulator of protease activity HflC (stomatin/prohibitin superfamily)